MCPRASLTLPPSPPPAWPAARCWLWCGWRPRPFRRHRQRAPSSRQTYRIAYCVEVWRCGRLGEVKVRGRVGAPSDRKTCRTHRSDSLQPHSTGHKQSGPTEAKNGGVWEAVWSVKSSYQHVDVSAFISTHSFTPTHMLTSPLIVSTATSRCSPFFLRASTRASTYASEAWRGGGGSEDSRGRPRMQSVFFSPSFPCPPKP